MKKFVTLVLFLLLSSSAWAQSYVQQAAADGHAPLTTQFPNNDVAGNTIWVGSSGSEYVSCSSTVPTDTEGNTFALLATIVGTGNLNQANQCVFAAFHIVGGTKDAVTCYGSNTTFAISCNIAELQGVNAFDAATCVSNACITDGNSSGIISSPAINTTFANEILIGFATRSMGGDCPAVFAGPGAGYTEVNAGSVFYEYRVLNSVQMGVTATVDRGSTVCEWSLGAYAFYEAPTIALNPQTVASGYPSTGSVGLATPAPPGGTTVMISSSNPTVADVPASVLVPAGSSSTTFAVNTGSVSSSTLANISAVSNGVTTSVATLAVLPVNPNSYSIWSSSAAPTVSDDGGTSPVEVGVKFTTDATGFISGIRFYKSAANIGTHIGNLWTSSGQLLATATFTGETGSGWQQVNFSSPVLVTANTIFVASYYTGTGHTSDDNNYFTNIGVDNAPLHASAGGASGGNGVFTASASSTFPASTNLDSNYWVDVVFMSASSPAPLQNLSLNSGNVAGGATLTGTVTLSIPAPDGGTLVALSSNSPSVGVPGGVMVAAGATSAGFTVTTTPVVATTSVVISASLAGTIVSASATVNPPVVTSLALSPTSVVGGSANAVGTVTLSSAAPSAGLTVSLFSSNPAAATVPGSITLAAVSSASFTVTSHAVTSNSTASISATFNGGTQSATLTVTGSPPVVTTNPANQTVTAGATVTFTAGASGTPAPTVQWQMSTNGGTTFSNVAGATSVTLSFATTAAQNGNQYKAVFTNAAGTATTTVATLTVNSAPLITTNPTSQTVTAGATVIFTAGASGAPTPTVQWQVSTNGGTTFSNLTGATSATLSFATTAAQTGNQYKAVFTNAAGTVTTTVATLTVNSGPVITTNPASQTVTALATVTFTAGASGMPVPTVQWQVSMDGGVTFSNLVGATSATLSFATTAAQTGNQYKAVFTNTLGTATTTAATLTVNSAPLITTNPTSQAVTALATVTFTAGASGTPAPTVQWQVSTNGGVTFSNVVGATSVTLSFATTAGQTGNQYKAVFTNTAGTATTTVATLTVNSGPLITTNPTSQTVTAGSTVTFTAGASGTPAPTVQWQMSTNGGTTFSNVAGAISATLSFATTAGQTGNQYKAVFTNTLGTATTTVATLTVNLGPVITTNPTSQTVTAGATVTFTAGASGAPTPTVQWQVSTNGGTTFSNLTGATSATLSFATTAAQTGNQYKAVFTNAAGTVTTTVATLTVNSGPVITTNPASQTVTALATVTFTAGASGMPVPTVQWQVSMDGGVTFSNLVGATSATLSFATTAAQTGNQYKAVFTNTLGTATTTAATLTVNSAPLITTNPTSQAVTALATVTFTAGASGTPAPTVQWQVSTNGGVTFSNVVGATSVTLSFATTAGQTGNQYKAVFTNTAGTATTTVATLTVNSGPLITTNPTSQTVTAGSTVTFTAGASGTPVPTVQWQVSTNGGVTFSNLAGATSATLNFATTTAQTGNQYEAVFTNTLGTATTTAATLTVNSGPVITTNPISQTVTVGTTVTFTVGASGTPVPTVQWQVSTNGGTTFSNVAGATSVTLSFATTAGQTGNQYKAVFTNTAGTATTTVATLTVNSGPLITTNPTSQTVTAGATVTFTAGASGVPVPSVQWQVSTDGGVTFSNVVGATSVTLSFATAVAQTGNQYKAVFTNTLGTATTTVAALTVNPPPTTQSFWPTSTTPANVKGNDSASVELGLKFSSNVAGHVVGARVYCATNSSGTHTVHLWSSSGASLATATLPACSGWTAVNFSSPVAIAANTMYTISYHTSQYPWNTPFFSSPLTAGNLTAPINAGVYSYGSSPAYPTSAWQSSNYWVDVLFTTP